ncbi:hypothetical protein [Chryseobacterium echinoideorum]|uniref:hypothetical protein n=1 Tax=Chryseobacterium echinoideorum TaxID=1549648 RepID=UPI001184A745|nr:hypothetical protein [Chryseobacterium echinoideorum]
MKKILNTLFLGIAICSLNLSCEAEQPFTEGDSELHFNTTSQKALVTLNTGSSDNVITYGVTKSVDSDNTVEIVFNSSKSTAVLGTDFTIVEGTDVLKAGTSIGDFKINVKEAAAKSGKKAYFTIKSASLPLATFNREVEVAFDLVCPASTFPGIFSVKNVLFGTYDTQITLGSSPNTLILKDYIETGFDIVVNFNPLTGEASLPTTPQQTGYVNGANGMIMIKPAVDGTKGSIAFCNKKMILRLSYGTPTGATYTSGGKTSYDDVFTGY